MECNQLSNICGIINGGEGKNYAMPDCMAFLMERLGESSELNYWLFAGITGDGITQVYNSEKTTSCEYCVSGYLAGPEHTAYIFDTIGYDHTYVTAEQINRNKNAHIEKVRTYIDKGLPVIVKTNLNTRPGFNTDVLTYFLYIGYEDNGNILLFIREENATIFKYDTRELIEQDWIFVDEKKQDISVNDMIRKAVYKIPHWLTLAERNGMFFGAQAFSKWADDVKHGRFENEADLWANYGVYVVNLATNAGNSGNEPYLIKRFSEIDDSYTDMCKQVMNQYVMLSNQPYGIWKALEDLGGGFNVSHEVMKDKEIRLQIAAKLREAAKCMDEIVTILSENLKES